MTVDKINVEELLKAVKKSLKEDTTISSGLRASIEMMMVLIGLLVNRLGLNSSNSSTPPSQDPNRKKKQRKSSGKKPGGQNGHIGKTLEPMDEPDEIEDLSVDRSGLPEGEYTQDGYEARQVFDLDISVIVKEYRAEILKDKNGNKFVAEFPKGVTNRVQYGNGIKAHAVYLSQYQLLPYKRIEEYFADQIGLPLSAGTVSNFNQKCYENLEVFEEKLRKELIGQALLHADETGINIGGKRHWLHRNSNEKWTYLYPHKKRGIEAMDEMGVLPNYHGKLCHDHWKSYYRYVDIIHVLCNSHHLRELESVWEQDKQEWGKNMKEFLLKLNREVDEAGGMLEEPEANERRKEYREILKKGEKDCPPPVPPPDGEKRRGRLKETVGFCV